MTKEEAVEHLKFEIDNKMIRRTIFTNQAIGVILKELTVKNNKIDKAIKYIKEKQKIQYKYALSKIEIDELLKILEEE